MSSDRDRYEVYYSDKLWSLLPAVHRSLDSAEIDSRGPLREIVDRIGAQAAIVRRGIDRMWEDQSIETADDWLIPYIAELLATNLVSAQDARGQRIDVAKTIYYRRRKGTVAILEEIAGDVTGYEARVVEFFRRLGRGRHGFDPALGWPESSEDPSGARALQGAQGLVGPVTYSPLGGTADLRDRKPGAAGAYGASLANSAFDEYAHTADFRRGRGQVGWYNIPRLGVFLWRLYSYAVPESTPVAVLNCAGQFSFDPTGREIPLFAANARGRAAFGSGWVSPDEWQMPGPIRKRLLVDQLAQVSTPLAEADMDKLYPASLAVLHLQGSFFDLVDDASLLKLYPEIGRFAVDNTLLVDTLHVTYHYGFSSTIGAGPYDRGVVRQAPLPQPAPASAVSGGGNALVAPLAGLAPMGTLTIGDSLTYTSVSNVNGIQDVSLRAANRQRPVVRLPAPAPTPTPAPPLPQWVFSGAAGSELVLDGLLVSGGNVVLRGQFGRVRIVCCTFDSGTAGVASPDFALAVDGRALIPTTLFVEAQVRELVIDRCLMGPIAERAGGIVEKLSARDSVIQGLWNTRALTLGAGEADLRRCTLLGRARVHRLNASECILDDVVSVDDTQHGCVRFSAWAGGSVLPRRYESVEIAPRAPLFTSRVFGRPGYAQLLEGVDRAIVAGGPSPSIAEGAEDGSEMGAFAREKTAIKLRSLAIKYEEYMPLGLAPVFIPVT